jgi:hypothetical protein
MTVSLLIDLSLSRISLRYVNEKTRSSTTGGAGAGCHQGSESGAVRSMRYRALAEQIRRS